MALILLRRAEHVLFALLLVVGVIRAVDSGAPWIPVLAVSAGVAVWYLIGMVLARAARPDLAPLWLLVLAVGWAGLVLLSADFVWLVFVLFLLFLQLLPLRAGLPSVLLLTAFTIAVLARAEGALSTGAVLGPLIGAGVATVITIVYRDLRREGETRARLLAELTAAQDQLAATERQAGMLAERERLAREIHDTVAQSLSSIVLLLRGPATPRELDMAAQVAQSALEDTRRVVRALTPAELDGRPLPDALHRLVAAARLSGLAAQFTVDGDPYPLSTPVAVALLRVAQGAIANVQAHAGARRLVVTLTFQPEQVSLDVADDGRGFDPTSGAADGTGIGLSSMRARLAEVGGELVVESAPGEGTALSAVIPRAGAS